LYSILADLIVAVHAGYVGFVVIGQLLIWAGIAFKWKWVRGFWFRTAHLIAMLIVGLEAACGFECPLTTWEAQLRDLAGGTVAEGSFVGRLLHGAIFVNVDPALLEILHILVALLVLATFIFWPPSFRRFRGRYLGRGSSHQAT
jgi:hypothetical protein